jgi:hypothetical protein
VELGFFKELKQRVSLAHRIETLQREVERVSQACCEAKPAFSHSSGPNFAALAQEGGQLVPPGR